MKVPSLHIMACVSKHLSSKLRLQDKPGQPKKMRSESGWPTLSRSEQIWARKGTYKKRSQTREQAVLSPLPHFLVKLKLKALKKDFYNTR